MTCLCKNKQTNKKIRWKSTSHFRDILKNCCYELGVELCVWFLLYLLFIMMKIKSSVLWMRLLWAHGLAEAQIPALRFPCAFTAQDWTLTGIFARFAASSCPNAAPEQQWVGARYQPSGWGPQQLRLEQHILLAAWLIQAADWEHLSVLAQLRGSRVGIVIHRCVCESQHLLGLLS